MKKIVVFLLFLIGNVCIATEDLSKQATAFYSDNNYQKTMDLILQIPEDKRSAQDWLLLGNILDDKGEKDNAVFMYQKAINTNHKYYKAYYNLANYYADNSQYNMAINNYKKAASLNNENPYIYYNMACTYIKLGDLKKAKKDIGYMPENVPLYYELTAKEFITYMAELKMVKRNVRRQEVQEVIKEVGLEEVQNKLIRNLSRGYKQRVSMAGALIGNPDVIILDEPTVGLDPKQITEIRNLIKKLGQKHTVILSTHILSEVSQICERVIIINKGKIIAIDTPENLEKATKEKNSISITVEDPKDNMQNLKEKIKEIETIEFKRDNNDGTKQYIVTSSSDVDLRKKLFEVLPKEEIVIFELKKTETTLEDAFIKLIDKAKENDGIEEMQKEEVDNTQENDQIKNNVEEKEEKK